MYTDEFQLSLIYPPKGNISINFGNSKYNFARRSVPIASLFM
ncbi:hypothetical protein BACI71_30705 [Bacillus mycoides]|uniref:Uncharacterized protein n=1 Tax=Bacillus mycoides TaxID=1405 RepID=A0A653Y2M8_BACMY|nr:hypothetical protein BACI71_30705 [Bacillus mycoides]